MVIWWFNNIRRYPFVYAASHCTVTFFIGAHNSDLSAKLIKIIELLL